MSSLKGVIAAAATPLHDDLSIDVDGLVSHCRYLLEEGGCDAINLLGTTGEATSFSVDERLAAMRAVSSSGLPLARFMVGTGAAALDDAVRLTGAARDLGFAGALLLPPFYYKGIRPEAVVDYVSCVIERAGKTGLSLYLYHFPANSGVPYLPETVMRLRELHPDCLRGLKDSSGDLAYSAGLARTLPGLDVFPSDEGTLAGAAEHGFAGCISATVNVTGRFAQAALSGSTDGIRRDGLEKATRLRALMGRFPLVSAVKEALAGIHGDDKWRRLKPPLWTLPAEQQAALLAGLSTEGLVS